MSLHSQLVIPLLSLCRLSSKIVTRRPPIVTIMGHVDHGKTTLVDLLRRSNLCAAEPGGITQHMSAFQVEKSQVEDKNQSINRNILMTLIDTPGHAAFKRIRTRGAKLTDMALLIVALDNGVQEQTIECINLLDEQKTPFIVVLNKADKFLLTKSDGEASQSTLTSIDMAIVDKVSKQLSKWGVRVEQIGGQTQCVSISAKTGFNIDSLLQCIEAEAEILDLKVNVSEQENSVPPSMAVLEAKMIPGLGICTTVLVFDGVLKVHDWIAVPGQGMWGRIRSMQDCDGKHIERAYPGQPVLISGWNNRQQKKQLIADIVGHKVIKCQVENQARSMASTDADDKLDNFIFNGAKLPHSNALTGLELIVLSDTVGSEEAMKTCLAIIPQSKASISIVQSAVVDEVNQTHIEHAIARAEKHSPLTILAYNVKVSPAIMALARKYRVPIIQGNIIYELIKKTEDVLAATLPPIEVEEIIARATVLQLFPLKPTGHVIGVRVEYGLLSKSSTLILEKQFGTSSYQRIKTEFPLIIHSIRQEKHDMVQVGNGQDCGIRLNEEGILPTGITIKPGDRLLAIRITHRPASLT